MSVLRVVLLVFFCLFVLGFDRFALDVLGCLAAIVCG